MCVSSEKLNILRLALPGDRPDMSKSAAEPVKLSPVGPGRVRRLPFLLGLDGKRRLLR